MSSQPKRIQTVRNDFAPRHGLTLIEVMVSLVLVSTILLVSITASANLFRDQTAARTSMRANELAGMILDEVSVREFRDRDDNVVFGLEPNEDVTDRSTFDDVDDYDGYVMVPPTFRDGTEIEGFAMWTLALTVQRAEPTTVGVAATIDDASPLRLVTVTCTSPSGATTSESILVSEIGSSIPTDVSYDRMRRLDLDFSDQRNIEVSAPLRNLPPGATN